MVGVNIFQFASLSTTVPLMDNVVAKDDIKLPGSVYQTLPTSITDQLDRLVAYLNQVPVKELLLGLAIVLFLSIILKSVFSVSSKLAMESVSQSVVRDLMTSMYSHIQELPVQYFSTNRTGDIISRLTNDVYVVQSTLSARLAQCVTEIFQLPFLIGAAFILNWKMTLIAGIFLPILLGPIIMIGQRLRKLSKKTQEKIADIVSLLEETITGIRIVRAFNMEKYEVSRFYSRAHKYYKLRMKAIRRDVLVSPLTEIVGVLCMLVVGILLLKPVLEGKESLGPVVAFCAALLISIKPFRSLGKLNNVIQRSSAALKRIYDLLDTVPSIREIPNAIEIQPLQHELRFDRVAFQYNPETEPIIKNLSLTVKSGEMIAIVGPSGAGKTSLVNLLPRFFDVTEGTILFDGIDIRDATFASLRGQIGIVTQETVLFNDTVANNIAYGKSDADRDKIVAAARAANADIFIGEMADGYDTIIGERGTLLSGGQRQRLAIARAIYKDPQILILDEATSALDTESERLVQEAIDHLVENRTVFAIAHRLSTIQHADRILVMSDGEVVQIGSHDALITDEEGLYRKLHDMQFQNSSEAVPTGLVDFIKYKFREARKKHTTKDSSLEV